MAVQLIVHSEEGILAVIQGGAVATLASKLKTMIGMLDMLRWALQSTRVLRREPRARAGCARSADGDCKVIGRFGSSELGPPSCNYASVAECFEKPT